MKKIATIIVIAFSSFMYGQQGGAYAGTFGFTTTQVNAHEYFEQYGITEAKLHTIKGSPYDQPVFLLGNIYNSTKALAGNIPLRYNIFADEIEIKDATSDEYTALIKSPEYFVKINGELYVYVLGDTPGYFKVLTEGKNYDLYKRSTVKYVEATQATDSYSREIPARFSRTDTYFIVSKSGSFYELPNNRKKFTNIFSTNRSNIDDYLKKNKIDLKDEVDMIKVMNYIDGLDF